MECAKDRSPVKVMLKSVTKGRGDKKSSTKALRNCLTVP